ncbi:MAG: polysaccharide deacetylase family protein [Oligoflexia bacterium]|nr:polysaccharide deacetylase family protein [Oligoflexia bacterium]
MKTSLPVLFLVSVSLAACASVKNEKIDGKPADAVSEARTPASSMDEENLEKTFQGLLGAEDADLRIQGYLSRLVSIYLVADGAVKQFDRELEATLRSDALGSVLQSPVYPKLLALYALTFRERTKIAYVYRRLLETEKDRSASSQQQQNARRARVNFEVYLFRQSGVERLALHDVLLTVNDTREAMGLRPRKVWDPRTLVNRLRSYRKEIARRWRAETEVNFALQNEVGALASEIEKKASSEGRSPQSDTIYPNPGKAGNISGYNFPANTWTLTYDDGPSTKYTPQVLANLRKHGVKATFFWTAQNLSLDATQEIIRTAMTDGNVGACHSYTHANLPKLSDEALRHEIVDAMDKSTEIYGVRPKFFRCPYGAGLNVPRVRQLLADQNLIHVFWNVDTLDWQDKDPESILARAQKQMAKEGRGVVLFHDIHPQSVIASEKLLAVTAGKVRWASLPEIVDEVNGKAPVSP